MKCLASGAAEPDFRSEQPEAATDAKITTDVAVWCYEPYQLRRISVDRRTFLAGSIGLSLTARAGETFAQSGPLTKIIFPVAILHDDGAVEGLA